MSSNVEDLFTVYNETDKQPTDHLLNPILSEIYDFTSHVLNDAYELAPTLKKITKFIGGVNDIVKNNPTIGSEVAEFIKDENSEGLFKEIKDIFTNNEGLLKDFSKVVRFIKDFIAEHDIPLSDIFSGIYERCKEFYEKFEEKIDNFIENFEIEVFENIYNFIKRVYNSIKDNSEEITFINYLNKYFVTNSIYLVILPIILIIFNFKVVLKSIITTVF